TGLVNEQSGEIAYELTWLAMGVFALIYLLARKQKVFVRTSKFTLGGAVCETAGQIAYIYALGPTYGKPTVAAPLISTYCVFSMVLSRVFLKEKLTAKRIAVLATVVAGILAMGIAEGLAEM
ncbi:MAG: EamA family transporter, partial [Clostridia bacterium]|nr:EamA family transporter [Clostridia bacterium]